MTIMLVPDDLLESEIGRLVAERAGAIHNLAVVAIDGCIRLCGIADSYDAKRRATELTEAVGGVRRVINQLRVIPSSCLSADGLTDFRASTIDLPLSSTPAARRERAEAARLATGE